MWNRSKKSRLILFGLAASQACAVCGPALGEETEKPATPMRMKADQKMAEHCAAMQAHKKEMAAELKAQDAQLTAQVAEMNAAPEEKKLALCMALISRMVTEKALADAHAGKMQDAMMEHMMEHMGEGKASMSCCPMMKGGMTGSDDEMESGKEHQSQEK